MWIIGEKVTSKCDSLGFVYMSPMGGYLFSMTEGQIRAQRFAKLPNRWNAGRFSATCWSLYIQIHQVLNHKNPYFLPFIDNLHINLVIKVITSGKRAHQLDGWMMLLEYTATVDESPQCFLLWKIKFGVLALRSKKEREEPVSSPLQRCSETGLFSDTKLFCKRCKQRLCCVSV